MNVREQVENFPQMIKRQKDAIHKAWKNLKNGQRVFVYDPASDQIQEGTARLSSSRNRRGYVEKSIRIRIDGESRGWEINYRYVMPQ